MKPAIIIPTYWAQAREKQAKRKVGAYDHTTPLDAQNPDLETCLVSLEQVRGVLRVIILLVVDRDYEKQARARVDAICREHPNLSPLVIGSAEGRYIKDAVSDIAPDVSGEPVSLRGYGAIRNMGLVVAAVLGYYIAVFMDDDETAVDENFLIDAVYGLGNVNRQDLPIDAKSGYFLDTNGSCYADVEHPRWADKYWAKRSEFNEWMHIAQESTRISHSQYVCGGCFALHANAFSRIAFDPYITRGEDMDYLINMRMHGREVWFDNQWYVKHNPPETTSAASRFLQDVYRWSYEYEKVRFSNTQRDLHIITRQSLEPYPAPWLSQEVFERIKKTSFRHALVDREHFTYFTIWASGRFEARRWARRHAQSYLQFQTFWPRIMASLWSRTDIEQMIMQSQNLTGGDE